MRTKLPNDPGHSSETTDAARRVLLGVAAVSPLLLAGLFSRPATAQTPACFDVNKLPMSQRSFRNSLGFKMVATDPNKKCSNCSFFTPGAGDCGKCQIFDNGPTTVNSGCNSWAKKS